MRHVRLVTRWLALFTIGLLDLMWNTQTSLGQEVRLDSRAAVVAWLRHHEQLVRTAECELEFTPSPTRPEMAPLIADLGRLNKTSPHVSFLIGESYVRKNTYTL